MFFLLFVFVLGVIPSRALLSLSPLSDCPNVSPQNGVKIEQVTGSWRLAYLFVDDNDELEEDNTCAVADIMQVNETKLEMILFVDGRKDEFTIDRYTKEFDVTMLSPTEWVLHTAFTHLEHIHVTVISSSQNHLVLTFCADPFDAESQLSEPAVVESPNNYNSFMNGIDGDTADDIFKPQSYNKFFKEFDDLEGSLARQRRVRRPSRLLRGKRLANSLEEGSQDESAYEKMLNYLKDSKKSNKPQKHLWTAILVKDNDISALKFVEKASLLMKHGFKIAKGQLISFGSCNLSKK